MNCSDLHHAVQSAAGLRLRLRLQPMYGVGEIVFPCTVAGGKYLISPRRIPGYDQSVECAILDSVQSQANRMEDALLADIRAGNIQLPHVETDFSAVQGLLKEVGAITCFEAPHRIFDAILRDSVDAHGTHFPFTDQGKKVAMANSKNALAIYQTSPASLLFGSWDSTGVSGGLGEKYTRCVVSEVVGIDVESAARAGTRIDPLNAAGAIDPQKILGETKDPMWGEIAKNRKSLKKPSELNHSSVPWGGEALHGGITCAYIQQSTTISFPALRQLHFPVAGEDKSPFAHTVLAAIALHAAALNVERGWHLRSRCDLVLDDGVSPEWEILGGPAAATKKEPLAAEQTREVLKVAIAAAKKAGLTWNDEPIRLKPSPALEKLVVQSQKAHRESAAE